MCNKETASTQYYEGREITMTKTLYLEVSKMKNKGNS